MENISFFFIILCDFMCMPFFFYDVEGKIIQFSVQDLSLSPRLVNSLVTMPVELLFCGVSSGHLG